MNNSTPDAGIPVLTEIISPPISAPISSPPLPLPIHVSEPATFETETMPRPLTHEVDDQEKWERLESELRERVLQQVLDRIDFVLEQRVRDSLADVLQTAVEGLALEIKTGLHHTLKEVVTRAVSQELVKLQSSKK